MLIYEKGPLQLIAHPAFEAAGVKVFVKREDLNHPWVSGNKWWKLRDNLQQAINLDLPVLTFGGAFSNHIFATAAATSLLNLKSIGIIRGERIDPLNSTLRFAEERGMHLHFVSRETYRKKNDEDFLSLMKEKFGKCYVIPEGGTNQLAVQSCEDFAKDHLCLLPFDELFLPVGTGGTMAGIIAGLKGERKVTGISVLKNGDFLNGEVNKLLQNNNCPNYGNWQILTSYHHGGYAKATAELKRFIAEMYRRYNLPLDHVYTGKLLWAVVSEAEKGNLKRGSTILVLHTGGLQNTMPITTTT